MCRVLNDFGQASMDSHKARAQFHLMTRRLVLVVPRALRPRRIDEPLSVPVKLVARVKHDGEGSMLLRRELKDPHQGSDAGHATALNVSHVPHLNPFSLLQFIKVWIVNGSRHDLARSPTKRRVAVRALLLVRAVHLVAAVNLVNARSTFGAGFRLPFNHFST
jgi:hypothetical protein